MNADRYFENAQQCRQFAERAESPKAKEEWLEIAARWERLAEQTEHGLARQEK
jgi:hypothetical protein